jgi:hypothetical protein
MRPKHNNLEPVYILLHIHKCAGLSQTAQITRFFDASQYYGLYNVNDPFLENRSAIKIYLQSLTAQQLDKVRVIAGHGAYYGIHRLISRPCRYVTFLREPHARTISNYAYFIQNHETGKRYRKSIVDKRGGVLSFASWFQTRTVMHDYMTRFLYLRLFYQNIRGKVTNAHLQRVIERLKTFYLVGIVERPMDHWFLYDSLGLPIVARRRNQTSSQFYPQHVLTATMTPHLVHDIALYNYFLSHPQPPLPLLTKAYLSLRYFKHRLLIVQ